MPLKKGARAPDYLCLCLINIKSAVLDSQGCGAPLRGYVLDNPKQAD